MESGTQKPLPRIPSPRLQTTSGRLWDFFKAIDARTNDHGKLSDADMVLALKELGIPLSDVQIASLVAQIEHHRGKITFAAFKHTIEHHHKTVWRPMRCVMALISPSPPSLS